MACQWILAPFIRWPRLAIALLSGTAFYVWFYPEELFPASLAWSTTCIDAYALVYMRISLARTG